MSDEINRRAFGVATVAGVVAAATLSVNANAQTRANASATPPHGGAPHPASTGGLLAAPGEKALVPLPFAAGSLPGLSERLITSHHDNNYATAVRKLNEIRTQLASADPAQSGGYWSLYGSLKGAELTARNSSLLHEMYFANLGAGQTAPEHLATMIAQRFGSMERFQAQFRGAALAANGWVVLAADPASRTLEIIMTDGHTFGGWEAMPLLVLDVYEHAFAIDFGSNKGQYLDAFWRNVAWNEVATRTTRAIGRV